MTPLMKAAFSPAETPKDGYLGSVSITVADSVLLRGMALFQREGVSGYSLRFPVFGERKQSYIFPLSRDVYRSMLRLATDAMRNKHDHTACLDGLADICLSVTGELLEKANADGCFSLCIDGFCKLNGITTYETPYRQPDQSHVLVHFPSLIPHQVPKDQVLEHSIFHGLSVIRKADDGSFISKDYHALITDMIRDKRAQLLMQRDPRTPQRVSDSPRRDFTSDFRNLR